MAQVRYGARSVEARRNREIEATKGEIWSQALTAIYETDPEVIAAVLPPPLVPPAEPLVRITITTVEMPGGYVVRCRLVRGARRARGRRGRVPAPHADDDRAGDGRRARDVRRAEEDRRGARRRATATRSRACIARMGFTLVEIRGPRRRDAAGAARTHEDRLLLQVPARARTATASTTIPRSSTATSARRRGCSSASTATSCSRTRRSIRSPTSRCGASSTSTGASARRSSPARSTRAVPAEWLLPFVHQRYDDLSVLGKGRTRTDTVDATDRYLIISADCHAGLPCEEYRPYLDAHVPRGVRRVPRRAARGPRPTHGRQRRLHHAAGKTRTPKGCAARSTRRSATRSSTATASPAR